MTTERVREDIAAEIQFIHQGESPPSWSVGMKQRRLEEADQILAIKGIAVLSDEQELPKNEFYYGERWLNELAEAAKGGYELAQQEMVTQGWKKVEEKNNGKRES